MWLSGHSRTYPLILSSAPHPPTPQQRGLDAIVLVARSLNTELLLRRPGVLLL